jgi:hypothetical protein
MLTKLYSNKEYPVRRLAMKKPYESDRKYLVNFMKKYLDALVRHDARAVPFCSEVKFVQNTAALPVGMGLWLTASAGPADFQIYAADPEAQQVACLVVMKELGRDILLGARLKLEDLKIREAEHHIIKDLGTGLFGKGALENLKKPRPGLLEDVPEKERMPRWQLLKIGRSYYDALQDNNGKLCPFAKKSVRHENGMQTAPMLDMKPDDSMDPELKKMIEAITPASLEPGENSVGWPMTAGQFTYISSIRDRRVLIADRQKGLTVGFSNFYHDSTVKKYRHKHISGKVEERDSFQGTFNLPAMHILKIRKGLVYDIEAIGFVTPYGTKSGWE